MKFILLVIASFALAGSIACDANRRGAVIEKLPVQRPIAVEPENSENDLVLKRYRQDTKTFNTKAQMRNESSPERMKRLPEV